VVYKRYHVYTFKEQHITQLPVIWSHCITA